MEADAWVGVPCAKQPDAFVRTVTMQKKFGTGYGGGHGRDCLPEFDQRIDALIQHMAGKDVPSVRYVNGQFVPDFRDPVCVAGGIDCRVKDIAEQNGEPSSMTIELSSTTRTVGDMRRFIEECYQMYRMNIQNQLGTSLYVFEQATEADARVNSMPGMKVFPPYIRFTRHPFRSTRTLDTIFHDQIDMLKRRLTHFMTNKDWYREKGIPHTLGILLHGVAGSGKTSIIKALANETQRHIVSVNLANVKTRAQLHSLFFDDNIRVACSDNPREDTYQIPIDRRLYVLEVRILGGMA